MGISLLFGFFGQKTNASLTSLRFYFKMSACVQIVGASWTFEIILSDISCAASATWRSLDAEFSKEHFDCSRSKVGFLSRMLPQHIVFHVEAFIICFVDFYSLQVFCSWNNRRNEAIMINNVVEIIVNYKINLFRLTRIGSCLLMIIR